MRHRVFRQGLGDHLFGGPSWPGAYRIERDPGQERRLCQEARLPATMGLGRVDQERVAEIDGPGRAGRRRFRAMRGFDKPVGRELWEAEPGIAGRGEATGDIAMRAGADAGRRIVRPDIGEQEQRQQRPAAGYDIGAPVEEIG